MRKFVVAAAAVASLVGAVTATTTPASAQPYGYWRRPHYRGFYGPRPFFGPYGYGYGYGYRPLYRPYYRPYAYRWHRW